MNVRAWIQVAAWATLSSLVVALATWLLLDWRMPSRVTIGPGEPAGIVVFIGGAVATPGNVHLPAGARVQDAIDAAGGLSDVADLTMLNPAARVGDGERIVVPGLPGTDEGPRNGTPVVSPAGARININTAPVGELVQLPGIGPVIAERIVTYREANGPFTTVDQLDEVEGISAEMVDELRPLVTTGD